MWALRFVVLMLMLGFPISLVITWAFELTPDGIKLTKKVNRADDEQVPKAHYRKRNWASLGFAAALPTVIFGTLALYSYVTRSGSGGDDLDKSIAVLPFENRSRLADDQYFSDGIHDDLLTYLSRIKDIKTVSRTSVMPYREKLKAIPEIAKELGVGHYSRRWRATGLQQMTWEQLSAVSVISRG